MQIKREFSALSRRYATALRKHLKQGPRASLRVARALGCHAVAIGLETLDLARIHQEALATLQSSSRKGRIARRAEIFFTEAITPIEKTHHAALKTNVRLSQLNKRLGRRTADLALSNRSLKQGVVERKTAEKALKKSGEHGKKLLEESRRLHKHLQRLTHQILSAQEDERKKISRHLQNEIAQTLLGINVRLLTLKKGAAVDAGGLKKEIATTQRLVDNSVKSIIRFARDFDGSHET